MATLLLLAMLVVAGPALVVLTFLTTRALVHGGGRRGGAAAGLAVTLVALAAWLALGFGGVRNYSDTGCFNHAPPGFDEGGSSSQGVGLWPPGVHCRFETSTGVVSTYRDGFDLIWVATAMTAVFAATMGLAVVTVRYSEGTVHFSS